MSDRVDGTELPEPREPGSDAFLILGLLALLRKLNPPVAAAIDKWTD
jgi:hypothetical protein